MSLGRERATKGQAEARAEEDPVEERAKDARRRARSDFLVKKDRKDRRVIAVVHTNPRDPKEVARTASAGEWRVQ